jgi:bifunctional non-homologous end joining protein LigD
MSPKLLEFDFKNNPNYFYQIKWDGVRMLTYKEGNKITLLNKYGKDKTKQFPELQNLANIKEPFILDGEIMVVEGRKNSFSKILKRNNTTDIKKISFYVENIPITYSVFDLLYFNGKWLMDKPIEYRQDLLKDLIQSDTLVHLCQNFQDPVELFYSTKKLGLEGIIAKKKGSKYIEGKKSYDWIKYKHRQNIEVYIGGILVEDKQLKSLAIGIYERDEFTYIGNVGTGLSEVNKEEILKKAVSIVTMDSPFRNFKDKQHIWLYPRVKCLVEFMEWTDDNTLRSPIFKGFLEDKHVTEN